MPILLVSGRILSGGSIFYSKEVLMVRLFLGRSFYEEIGNEMERNKNDMKRNIRSNDKGQIESKQW